MNLGDFIIIVIWILNPLIDLIYYQEIKVDNFNLFWQINYYDRCHNILTNDLVSYYAYIDSNSKIEKVKICIYKINGQSYLF